MVYEFRFPADDPPPGFTLLGHPTGRLKKKFFLSGIIRNLCEYKRLQMPKTSSKSKSNGLVRKEMRLESGVIANLQIGAAIARRGLINYMEHILVEQAEVIKQMESQKVGGKK